jgi:hypothetical protein
MVTQHEKSSSQVCDIVSARFCLSGARSVPYLLMIHESNREYGMVLWCYGACSWSFLCEQVHVLFLRDLLVFEAGTLPPSGASEATAESFLLILRCS